MSAAPLHLGLFSPSPVVAVGAGLGLFIEAGIALELEKVRSSPAQFADLVAGRYDAILTSPDNVLAYRYGTANPLGERIEATILLAVDRGLGLSLMGRPSAASPAACAGGRFAVDSRESGFALAGFELLTRFGLQAGRDYEVVELGPTPRRMEALVSGACDITMLNAGYDLRAERHGCRRLAAVSAQLSPYLATVLATTSERLARGDHRLRAFVTVMRRALALAASGEANELLERFAEDELSLTSAQAERYCATLRDASAGLVGDGRVDPAALANLVALRARQIPGSDLTFEAVSADSGLVAPG